MSFDPTEQSSEESVPSTQVQSETEGSEFDSTFVADGKKSSKTGYILGGLLLIGAITIWFMYFRSGPQSAQAGTAPNDGGSQIKEFLDSGNINMMKQTLKETEKIVKQFRAYPGKTQVPLESLRANPFRELTPKSDGAVATSDKEAKHTKSFTSRPSRPSPISTSSPSFAETRSVPAWSTTGYTTKVSRSESSRSSRSPPTASSSPAANTASKSK